MTQLNFTLNYDDKSFLSLKYGKLSTIISNISTSMWQIGDDSFYLQLIHSNRMDIRQIVDKIKLHELTK